MKQLKNTCAVCGKPIGISFLMCGSHWRSVPRQLQIDVYRTWGRMQRMRGAGKALALQICNDYDAARQAAIDAVVANELPTTGEGA